MIKEVEKGNSLLVKGPTRVILEEGKIDIFGKIMEPKKEEEDNTLIVPSANVYPFYTLTNSKFDIYTNDEDNLQVIDEKTISDDWEKIKDKIVEQIQKNDDQALKIMVLGISTGKSTLIKYLANNFFREGFEVGYLDSDLGQQTMYLPTTLNIGKLNDFIITNEAIEPEETVFIGSTFPKSNFKFIVAHSCKDLIEKYLDKYDKANAILIDSDGWIKTEAGIIYKNFFIDLVDPDIIIIFQDDSIEELKMIEKHAAKSKKRKIYTIQEPNKYFYEKTKDERRFLRQSQFAKRLEDFRKISVPLDGIKFVKNDFDKEKNKIVEKEVNVRDLINLPYHYVIIALLTEDSKLIKIGLLFIINLEKNYILLYSNLNFKEQKKVKKILIGSLRLSTKGNHQGYLYL